MLVSGSLFMTTEVYVLVVFLVVLAGWLAFLYHISHPKHPSTRTPSIQTPKPKENEPTPNEPRDYTPYELTPRQTDYRGYTYEQLLHTDEWNEKRQQILQQHDYHCDWCGTTRNLQVHHKYYSKCPDNRRVYPWVYKDDAFMVVCENCHKKYHSKYKVKTYYRKCW